MHGDTLALILVRHAEAASVGGAVTHDGERPLTARGTEDARAVGRMLAAIERTAPGLILTSTLRRSMETGELISSAFAGPVQRSAARWLDPGFRNAELFEELLALRRAGHQCVVAVGHQPDLGNFIGFLISGSAPTSVALSPGTAARLTLRVTGGRPEAVLQWLLSPAAAHALAPSSPHSPGKP